MRESNAHLDSEMMKAFQTMHCMEGEVTHDKDAFSFIRNFVLGIRDSKFSSNQAYYAAGVVAACANPYLFKSHASTLPPHLSRLRSCWDFLKLKGLPVADTLISDESGKFNLQYLPSSFDSLTDFYKHVMTSGDKVFLQKELSRFIKRSLLKHVRSNSSLAARARLNHLSSSSVLAWSCHSSDCLDHLHESTMGRICEICH
jgi:hypothetical protein